jgi:hypothetical protein
MLADPRLESLHSHPEFVKMLKILERMENAVSRKTESEG